MAFLTMLALAAAMVAGASPDVDVTAQHPDENQVKAAFLFNFAKFVDWPAGTFRSGDDQFAICVLGDDGFRETLANTVTGKTIAGRPIAVARVNDAGKVGASQIGACRMLFVSSPADRKAQSVLTSAGITSSGKSRAILTVADGESAMKDCMIITFLMENGKVRFEINASAAERAGLHISAKLLSLAQARR